MKKFLFLQFNTGNSWWPILISVSIFMTFLSLLNLLVYSNNLNIMISFLFIMFVCYMWFRDLKREMVSGSYNMLMQMVFKMGMVVFILSEVMFFFSFFWSYLHYMFMINGELGFMWPPVGIKAVNYMSIPLLNTLLLLSSGVSLTLSHNFILLNKSSMVKLFLLYTIMLGIIFTMFQVYEYLLMEFMWSNASYGSIFFMGTGFHGFHVLLGTSMLIFLLMNNLYMNLTSNIFEMVAWYWHFVDMVWILLFTEFYWWSF